MGSRLLRLAPSASFLLPLLLLGLQACAGEPSAQGPASATLEATSPVVADGVRASLVTVVVLDGAGAPLPGVEVTIATDRGAVDTVVQPAGPTDAAGRTSGRITSLTVGTARVTCAADGRAVPGEAVIEFIGAGECTPGEVRDCYEGPDGTEGIGRCAAGAETCGDDGFWGPCEGQILPSALDGPACDGLDDDCDERVDEDFDPRSPDSCGACDNPCPAHAHAERTCDPDAGICGMGACEAGWMDLDGLAETGCEYACVVTNGGDELCDGLDQDCDGDLDEGFDADGDGFTVCGTVSGGGTDPALADCDDLDDAIHPGAVELCNGADDDCNGAQDDGLTAPAGLCLTAGVCAGTAPSCAGAAGWGCPYPDIYEPNETRCDGIDNDCDLVHDEGCDCVEGERRPCGTDEGACTTGEQLCAGGVWGACSGQGPRPETCDGTDESCDGTIDEGFDPDGDGFTYCGTVPVGGTHPLREDCAPEDPARFPGATELCNGVDDDCDGSTDEPDAADAPTWYADGDGDGYGNPAATYVACEAPPGYVAVATDCDDNNQWVHPGASETCNGVDDDCDPATPDGAGEAWPGEACDGADADLCAEGVLSCQGGVQACSDDTGDDVEVCNGLDDDCDGDVDEGLATTTWYADADGDGYGDPQVSEVSCSAPAGYVAAGTDCDDGQAAVHPGAADVCNGLDDDCDPDTADGAAESWSGAACDGPDADACEEGVWRCIGAAQICGDDTGDLVEVCNGVDDDCDARIDEDLSSTWYRDVDGDGHGDPSKSTVACAAPAGYVAAGDDCDDTRGGVHPGAADVCNGIDDDCDAATPDGAGESWLGATCDGPDADLCAEGVFACVAGAQSCDDATGDAIELCNGVDDDCDPSTADGAAETWLGSACDGADADLCEEGGLACVGGAQTCDDASGDSSESCNGVDDDCDGEVDEGVMLTWYRDADGDGRGDASVTTTGCAAEAGWVADASDCDDTDATVFSGAPELCDGLDNDCDGTVDNGTTTYTFHRDRDGDGYGHPTQTVTDCAQPAGYVLADGDCDDRDAAIHPGAAEVCNGVDDDCDGATADGAGEAWAGTACDGPDADLCAEGTFACVAGAQSCDDATGDAIELCNGVDDDCDPSTADGAAETWLGSACDGADADLCEEGTFACVGGAQTCGDATGDSSESCNGLDDDCDGEVDEGVLLTWYRDADGDGHGDPAVTVQACTAPAGHVGDGSDCDDANAAVSPGAAEACNGVDDDCDPLTADGSGEAWVGTACDGPDVDLCDEGTFACVAGAQSCSDASGDDVEVCNGLDDDCDGEVDEGVLSTFYLDRDGDGYGDPAATTGACTVPDPFVADGTDCDDGSPSIHPGATELCNGIDENCNGLPDDGASDSCDDGAWCNGAEICDRGACRPGASPCADDGVACTVTGCDEATDACAHSPDDAACDDGLYCNGSEVCDGALGCVAGTPVVCPDDGLACTLEQCDEAAGACESVPVEISAASTVTASSGCLTLAAGGRATVFVDLRSPGGQPVSGAAVSFAVSGDAPGGWVEADVTESAALPGVYYRTLLAPASGASTTVTVSAEACGGAPVTLLQTVTVTYEAAHTAGGGTGGCAPADGNLRVLVLDADSGAPLPDAHVMVGLAAGTPLHTDVEAFLGGAAPGGANTALTDASGYAVFHDLGTALDGPLTVTAGPPDASPDRAYFTFDRVRAADLAMPLRPTVPATPQVRLTDGTATSFTQTSTTDDVQVGMVLPEVTLNDVAAFNLEALQAPKRCVNVPDGSTSALSENFYVPVQCAGRLFSLCVAQWSEQPWALTTARSSRLDMIIGSIPTDSVGGCNTFSDLMAAYSIDTGHLGEIGFLPSSATGADATGLAVDLLYGHDRLLTISAASKPPLTDLIGGVMGDYAGTDGIGPTHLNGFRLVQYDAADPNTLVVPYAADAGAPVPSGARYYGAVMAMYADHPGYRPAADRPQATAENGISTILRRDVALSASADETWAPASFLGIAKMSVDPDNRTFTWDPLQTLGADGQAPAGAAPHLSVHELHTVRETYREAPLACSREKDVIATTRTLAWEVWRPHDVSCTGTTGDETSAGPKECFTLPTLPASWSRAGRDPAGLKDDGLPARQGSGAACDASTPCVLAGDTCELFGKRCADQSAKACSVDSTCDNCRTGDTCTGEKRICVAYDGPNAYTERNVWYLKVDHLGGRTDFDFDHMALEERLLDLTHESSNNIGLNQ